MVDLVVVQLIFDAGLFVLICLVQLIIYPSFKLSHIEDFSKWHAEYTSRMGYIVMPLMLGQLIISCTILSVSPNALSILHFICVIGTWLITALISVPLHKKLQTEGNELEYVDHLCKTNWYRTYLWSAALLLSILAYF